MTLDLKNIHDPVHGSIRVGGVFLDILNRHEMQRLRAVKQLDLSYMVFPGANHSRFEHSLGVYHLSGRMADAVGMSGADADTVKAAGMLHDICHAPFSHTMEEITINRTGMDHMDLARKLITGDIRTYRERDEDLLGGTCPISEILEDAGISSKEVCDLIAYPSSHNRGLSEFSGEERRSFFPSGDYPHQIIHGPVDADQMDYLVRDAHFTGVAFGTIDIERILNTIKVHNDRIVMEKGGMAAAEGLIVSRSLMYSSVYFHRTVRIIKKMVTKAVEESDLDVGDMYTWDDGDLISALIAEGGKPSKIVRSVINRRLYKSSVTLFTEKTTDEIVSTLSQYADYRKRKFLEQEIADKAGIDISDVVVDIPSKSTLQSKINIGKTDVSILSEDGRVRSLTRLSPIAKAIQSRDPFGWSLVVASPKEHSEAVEKATRRILNL